MVVCEIRKQIISKCAQAEQDNICNMFGIEQVIQDPDVLSPD